MYTRVGQYIDWLYALFFFTFREANDQMQGAITQPEHERLTAIKRAERIQDELKKTLVRLNKTSSSRYHSFVHCVIDQGFIHDCLLGRGKNQSCVTYCSFWGAATGNVLNLGLVPALFFTISFNYNYNTIILYR